MRHAVWILVLTLTLLSACSKHESATLSSPVAAGIEEDTAASESAEEQEGGADGMGAAITDVDVECATELSAAKAALNRINDTQQVPSASGSEFPFDFQASNGCGVFPADILDKDSHDSEKTSQCNRAILARSLIECINWDLPLLPTQMVTAGFKLKILESEKIAPYKDAVTKKDWLAFLSLNSESKGNGPLDQFPDYNTIENLVETDAPKFTIMMGGDMGKYPELMDGELINASPYEAYTPCHVEQSLEPCEGKESSEPVHAKLHIRSVGRHCADNSIASRSDGEGWAMRNYKFDACRYTIVPRFDRMFNSVGTNQEYEFDEIALDTRGKLMEKLSYRETTLGEVRKALLAMYDSYVVKVQGNWVADQNTFFDDLESVRKYKVVKDETPLPPECQGPEIDAGLCPMALGPRYLPYKRK
jgi:hypothetical protein